MHFEPRKPPVRAQLRSLRCSLNSPVVSIPELPVGPGSAAIAIHACADGSEQITIAIRCRRTAEVACFGSDSPTSGDSLSIGAAMLWAEALGFLFDDELCSDASGTPVEKGVRNAVATRAWNELLGAGDSASDPEFATAAMLTKFRWTLGAPGGDVAAELDGSRRPAA